MSRLVRRANLRPAVLIVAFFSCIWGIIAGAASLRRRDDDLPSKVNLVYLVLGILYFICSALEAFGFFAAWKSSIGLVRSYFWASASIALIVTASELLRTIIHFTEKSGIQSGCIKSYATDVAAGTYTSSAVETFCKEQWRNATYVDIALLIFSFLVAGFFASLAASYLHQLQNPQLLRTHEAAVGGAASSQYAYPLQPYQGGAAPPYPNVNPYGTAPPHYGPSGGAGSNLPGYDNPFGVEADDDKTPVGGGYGGSGPYAPPPGPPPAAQNPFADSVEHNQPAELVRREGETAEEFEQRQHDHDVEMERTRQRFVGSESTETVTLGGRGAEGRV
ncbi:hypothetical protein JCM8097_001765 [Rhodosporidiobolus ruineniae]